MTKRPRIAVEMQTGGASKTASKEILAEYLESSRGVMNEFPRGLTEARKATTIKALEAYVLQLTVWQGCKSIWFSVQKTLIPVRFRPSPPNLTASF